MFLQYLKWKCLQLIEWIPLLQGIHSHSSDLPLKYWLILHFRCPCGYIKRDVMCIGDAVDREQKVTARITSLSTLSVSAIPLLRRDLHSYIPHNRWVFEMSKGNLTVFYILSFPHQTSSRLSFTCPFCALESVVILNKPIRGQAVQFFSRSKNPDRPPLTNHGS